VAQAAGSIDAVPFDDENGERHLVWKEDGNSRKQPTILWMQRLNEDGTKLVGDPKELIRNDTPWEGAVVEGPFIVKRDGWFYLFYSGSGCCGAGCNYAMGVARSRSLHGPYEKYARNPILAGNATWKCPGHGSIVTDPQGRYFLMYHAYAVKDSVFTGRQALLDEVKFGADGWPSINDGKGPSTDAPSPFGVAQKKAELNFSDDFSAPALQPGWQWPVADEPQYKIDRGVLVLSPTRKTNDLVGAVLARSTTSGDYSARAMIANLEPGVFAGIAAFGDPANAIGIAVSESKVVLWRRQKGKHEILSEGPMGSGRGPVPLGLLARNGHQFQFFLGSEGFGPHMEAKHLPPWDRNVRVALTAGGVENATARFDRFSITSDLTE
jgi:beta-xylosidase